MSTIDHPVWDVYDLLRTARLNELYYGSRLNTYESWNFSFEIVIAITSSTSAIAALAYWKTTAGQTVWQIILALAAIISVVKPILNFPKK